MDFLLRVFDDDVVRNPGKMQLVGFLLVLAATMSSWVAWSAQRFRDRLIGEGKDQNAGDEKRGEFRAWTKTARVGAIMALFLAITFFSSAMMLLFALAALAEPTTVLPQGPDLNHALPETPTK